MGSRPNTAAAGDIGAGRSAFQRKVLGDDLNGAGKGRPPSHKPSARRGRQAVTLSRLPIPSESARWALPSVTRSCRGDCAVTICFLRPQRCGNGPRRLGCTGAAGGDLMGTLPQRTQCKPAMVILTEARVTMPAARRPEATEGYAAPAAGRSRCRTRTRAIRGRLLGSVCPGDVLRHHQMRP